jgi:DNA-binding PadR family transcriptional regulator
MEAGLTETQSQPNQYLPLTPAVFHIMLVLADEDRHGYDIMREIAATTDGKILMGPGTLYGTIKRMLQAGLILEVDERPDPDIDDARRRYYRLTDLGQRVLKDEVERLANLVEIAQRKDLLRSAGDLRL